MRPVLVTDLICAGRALLRVPVGQRGRFARALLDEARLADQHCAQSGHPHPVFGDGTLAEAARRHGLAAEPMLTDAPFRGALICVLEAVGDSTPGTHRVSR